MTGGIGVFCERQDDAFTKGSLGLLEAAARLGSELGADVHALVFAPAVTDADAAALGAYGATSVHVAEHAAFGLSQPIADAVCAAHAALGLRYVLFSASILASDAAAAAAVRLDAGLVTDAVDLVVEDGGLSTHRAGLGDSVIARCAFTAATGVVVVRANTYAQSEAPAPGDAPVERSAPTISDASLRARIVGHEAAATGGVDINAAEILVGGGRGLGSPENFVLCEELAEALGGAVAATRAVVDAGWYPYASQVGQTGKTVSPKCYIACGISGAIQHKVGMQAAGTIIAINKDPYAPIFDFADLGVVGDLHQIVPRLTALVRGRTSG